MTVNGTLTADAWDGDKGGVMFVKVLQALVLGSVDMTNKGYRPISSSPGESYNGASSGASLRAAAAVAAAQVSTVELATTPTTAPRRRNGGYGTEGKFVRPQGCDW